LWVRRPINDRNGIADPNRAPLQHPGENAFAGHHAVADLMKDLTASMAGLADLGDREPDLVAEVEPGADGQLPKAQPGGGHVFSEITGRHIHAGRLNFGNALDAQQTNLTVPVGGMGIACQAVIYDKPAGVDIAFFLTFGFAHGEGDNGPGRFRGILVHGNLAQWCQKGNRCSGNRYRQHMTHGLKAQFRERLSRDLVERSIPGIPVYVAIWSIIVFATGFHQQQPSIAYPAWLAFLFCGILRTSFKRCTDVIARYGGEEFAILLPGTPLEDAAVLAESLRQEIAAHRLKSGQAILKATVSLGVAGGVPDHLTPAEALVGWAGQALYKAKTGGRNQVQLADAFAAMDADPATKAIAHASIVSGPIAPQAKAI
jgi:hypothetical protein